MTPRARNAPKLWPAEPVSLKWIVPSGRHSSPHRLAISWLRIVPTVRLVLMISQLRANRLAVLERRLGQVQQLRAVERQLEAVILLPRAVRADVRCGFSIGVSSSVRSRPSAFQCWIAAFVSRQSTRPTISSIVRKPSSAMIWRASSATMNR